jgi:tryptophanyl-tRNA synthetase
MRYLSGIQPSGTCHLGNYFGAMRRHIERQDQEGNECFYFIADYHALTTVHDAEELRRNVIGVALDYLAIGLDPARTVFYRHSEVPQVVELMWVLSTIAPMGLLERCHSYKDKLAKGIEPTHGLFSYPVLMAADILLFDSERVPVGQDQKQHLEVTRDLAQKLNHLYGETLVVPEAEIEESTAVVPGTDGQKMSKSYDNTIDMFASEKAIKKAIGRIVTDSRSVDEPKDPESNLIYRLYALVAAPDEREAMARRFRQGGYGYGDAKKELHRKVLEHFAPFRVRREELARDPGVVLDILAAGASRARAVAEKTIDRVYRAVGLRRP